MRNLKRVLSLSLASIMLLGMMVIGSSAAQDYSDVDYDNDNIEAIEVLDAINVMRGDLDDNGELAGTFRPGSDVKRSEMARIMAFLMDLDYDYYIGANPFADMVGHWAEKYAAACYANGIISGRTTTAPLIYDPDATVTAVEAASMLMRALGYFQNKDIDYPDGFEISTIRQAGRINLFNRVDAKTNEPMTRNDVAQLILNTLQSGMVEPGTGRVDVTVGDAQVTFGSSNYVYRVSRNDAVGNAINTDKAEKGNSVDGLEGPILDLGEQLYQGKLRLNKDEVDAFGRPARMWEFDGAEIGTYTKDEQLVDAIVGEVTGKDLFDLLGASVVSGNNPYNVYCYIDGLWTDDPKAEDILGAPNQQGDKNPMFNILDMNKNNKAKVGGTGTGVLTEVYVDHDEKEVRVAVINTYLAIADNDYDSKRESVNISAYSMQKAGSYDEYVKLDKNGTTPVSLKLTIDEFPAIVDIAKDDPLLITVAEGEVQTIQSAQVLEAVTITTFAKKSSVVSDGVTYKYTTTAGYKYDDDINQSYTTSGITNLKERTYNIYLDNYSNLIGIKEVEAKNNYLFITGIDLNNSNLVNQNADANAIFLDGTVKTIKVNMGKSEWNDATTAALTGGQGKANALLNTWCTYSVSGDVYTVTEVAYTGVTTTDNPAPVYYKSDATQTPNNTGEKLAQFNQKSDKDDFYIDAKHYRLYGGGGNGERYYNVYADKDSVFLTAKLGELITSDAGPEGDFGIIKGVSSVSVGIENTDLIVWKDATAQANAEDSDKTTNTVGKVKEGMASSGVYGLYNKDGLIVAAVVVGDDAGSSKDFVFVNSNDLKDETYNGESTAKAVGDGLWTWTREVIRNGEKVLLTEVGDDYNSELKKMKRYEWWQIGTNADGNVTSTVDAATAAASNSTIGYTKLYTGINDQVEAENVKTVVYQGYDSDKLTTRLNVEGNNTLAVEHRSGSGFWFTDDVRVVLIYFDRNKSDTEIVEVGKGPSDLKWMVDIVNGRENDRGTNPYYINALIVDGKTTDIVIYDTYNDYTRPEGSAAKGDIYLADNLVKADVGSVTGTVTVDKWGEVVADITLTKPEWAAVPYDNAAAELTYDVYIDGKPFAKNAGTIKAGAGSVSGVYLTPDSTDITKITKLSGLFWPGTDKSYVASKPVDNSAYQTWTGTKDTLAGHEVTLEITSIKWNYVRVVFESDIDIGLPAEGWTENSGTARNILFKASTLVSATPAKITKITGVEDAETFVGTDVHANGSSTTINVKPLTNQIIKITVKAPEGFAPTYDLTVNGEDHGEWRISDLENTVVGANDILRTDAGSYAKISIDGVSGIKSEEPGGYAIKVEYASSVVKEAELIATINGVKYPVPIKFSENKDGEWVGTGQIRFDSVTEDMDLTGFTLKTTTKGIQVKSASIDNDGKIMKIVFMDYAGNSVVLDEYVDLERIKVKRSGDSNHSALGVQDKAETEDDTLTVTLNTAMANSDDLRIEWCVFLAGTNRTVGNTVYTITLATAESGSGFDCTVELGYGS